MDFQQFVVRSKDLRTAYIGCLVAGVVLIFLAFLPTTVVMAAKLQHILPESIHGKETIPYILSWVGSAIYSPAGIVLVLFAAIASLGSGSAVLRIMTVTILDFTHPANHAKQHFIATLVGGAIAFAVALTGKQIVSLIVSFYAVYVAAILVPFVAFVIEKRGWTRFTPRMIRLSLMFGAFSSIIVLVSGLIFPEVNFLGNSELTILLIGIGFSVAGLLIGGMIEATKPRSLSA